VAQENFSVKLFLAKALPWTSYCVAEEVLEFPSHFLVGLDYQIQVMCTLYILAPLFLGWPVFN